MMFHLWEKFGLVALCLLFKGGIRAFVAVPVATVANTRRMITLTSAPAKGDAISTSTQPQEDDEDPSVVMIARLVELDMLLEQAGETINEIDDNMALATDDDYLCLDLQKKKERVEKQMNKYWNEVDRLEARLEEMGYSYSDEDEMAYSDNEEERFIM